MLREVDACNSLGDVVPVASRQVATGEGSPERAMPRPVAPASKRFPDGPEGASMRCGRMPLHKHGQQPVVAGVGPRWASRRISSQLLTASEERCVLARPPVAPRRCSLTRAQPRRRRWRNCPAFRATSAGASSGAREGLHNWASARRRYRNSGLIRKMIARAERGSSSSAAC